MLLLLPYRYYVIIFKSTLIFCRPQFINFTDPTFHLVTVYPKKFAHGFCFAVLCCGYTLTDFPISIRLTSLALWQSNDCPSASKASLMNMDKYFMWIHNERLHNHNKAKHNKTVCMFLGIYCTIATKDNTIQNNHISIATFWTYKNNTCSMVFFILIVCGKILLFYKWLQVALW